MYKFYLKNLKKAHQYEELIRTFIKDDEFIIVLDYDDNDASNAVCKKYFVSENFNIKKEWTLDFKGEKNILKKELFQILLEETGKKNPWGIITGIRPVKLFGKITDSGFDGEDIFREIYMVSGEKAKLSKDIYQYQQKTFRVPDKRSVGIYIGIPFCPTRCTYCSFTSNKAGEKEKEQYLKSLIREIKAVADIMREKKTFAESIYIGGGTPTTLNNQQLSELFAIIREELIDERLSEFTIEAGRADTITKDKIMLMNEAKVDRISINPQSMNNSTLKKIGREHSAEAVESSFAMARKLGNMDINADLIVGLPGENLEDFKYSLNQVIKLGAENITVHTLSIKRKSRLSELDKNYYYNQDKIIIDMLDYTYKRLYRCGYVPYYLYRQKNMSAAGENVGFCKKGSEGLYNVRIMAERQTILAMGAGGISKVYFPEEDRLERIPNVSNYEVYIDRVDEMVERKRRTIFKEAQGC